MPHSFASAQSEPSDDEPGLPGGRHLWLVAAALVAVAVLVGIGRALEGFAIDEPQHLHAAWLVSRGLVPYRDYFDHHMPMFHVLMAPVVSAIGRNYFLLYAATRLLALAVLAAILAAFARLMPRNAPAGLTVGALALLVVTRGDDALFHLRPDFVALALLMWAVVLLSRTPISWPRGVAAGLLAGAALLFTQKSASLLPAFAFCVAIGALRAPRGERAAAWRHAAASALACAVPIGVFIAALHRLGALQAFVDQPVLFVSHWTEPISWRYHYQETVTLGLPVCLLGFAWAFRSAWAWLARRAERYPADGLLGMLALAGAAGFAWTPVKTGHAYVFCVQIWLCACAMRGLVAWLETSTAERPLGHLRGRPAILAVGAALAPLTAINMAVCGLIGAAAAVVWRVKSRPARASGSLAALSLAVVAFVPSTVALCTFAERASRHSVGAQLAAMRQIDCAMPEGTVALTAWPIATPARPGATFNWFSDPGFYVSMDRSILVRQFRAALESPNTSVVVCWPGLWQRYAPDLLDRLHRGYRELPLQRNAFGDLHAYVRCPAPQAASLPARGPSVVRSAQRRSGSRAAYQM